MNYKLPEEEIIKRKTPTDAVYGTSVSNRTKREGTDYVIGKVNNIKIFGQDSNTIIQFQGKVVAHQIEHIGIHGTGNYTWREMIMYLTTDRQLVYHQIIIHRYSKSETQEITSSIAFKGADAAELINQLKRFYMEGHLTAIQSSFIISTARDFHVRPQKNT